MIVVDASVVVAALLRDGRTRDVLLHCDGELVAPPAVHEETLARLDELAKRAKLPVTTMERVVAMLLSRIRVIPAEAYAAQRPAAQSLVRRAQAWGDDEYVALALALDAPVWTLDHDFRRVPGLRVLSTDEVDAGAA